MSQAILTRYLGPTNHRGARVKATCDAGSVTVPWDYAQDPARNHELAAHALCRKLGWSYPFVQGGIGNGYAFVFTGVPS